MSERVSVIEHRKIEKRIKKIYKKPTIGNKFGRLTVIEKIENEKKSLWECQCECGNIKITNEKCLRYGYTKSCGCYKKETDRASKNSSSLKNLKFGKLTVTSDSGRRSKSGDVFWNCTCECGRKSQVTSTSLRSKHSASCGKCIKKINRVGDRVGLLIVESRAFVKNKSTYWKCKCDCGNFSFVCTSALINGVSSCGCIKRSLGERLVEKFLQSYMFNFEKEYKISECKRKRPLPFDFCVKINNKIYLIEFQGEHHYHVVKRFGEAQHFRVIENDKIKKDFCLQNNIPFLAIPYTEIKSINILLEEFLKT